MSALQEFLNIHPVDNITDEVAISNRFKDANGQILKFKIKAMSNHSFEDIRKRSTVMKKGGKMELDFQKFNNAIVVENTINPNFKDADSIKKVSCATPDEYLNRVLLAGEVSELSEQIQKLSGFNRGMDELVEEGKN